MKTIENLAKATNAKKEFKTPQFFITDAFCEPIEIIENTLKDKPLYFLKMPNGKTIPIAAEFGSWIVNAALDDNILTVRHCHYLAQNKNWQFIRHLTISKTAA